MTKCKTDKGTCPFLYSKVGGFIYACNLGYVISYHPTYEDVESKDCKLKVVQYATDKPNSITFIPEHD